MGQGMARSLLRAGHPVTVWNRTADKAAPLARDGARVASSPEDAVRDADVVLTMLFDVESVLGTMARAVDDLSAEAVWVQSSTIGVDGAGRVATFATDHGLRLVDAPVLGTRKPAEDGTLVVLASGAEPLRERVAPVFDAIGSRTLWVGVQPDRASALKLVCNAWVATVTAGVAQSLALAEGLGLEPELFLRAIEGHPTDAPYAHLKGGAMLAGEFPVAFSVDGVVKDLTLIVSAAEASGVDPAVAVAVLGLFDRASQDGLGGQDMAAVHRVLRPRDSGGAGGL
jgi:3-hydroxyisobutyrate dehydrogenase